MKSIFDKLNLRPQERRFVVIILLVVFVLLNMWFVWPFFTEWGRVQTEISRNRTTLERYQAEIAKRPRYEARQRELETTGSEMLASETDLQRIVQSQAAASGVQLGGLNFVRGHGVKTNQFFQEGGVSIQFTAGGKELVDFLVGVAAQNAMVRVQAMNVRPADAGPTRLAGTMTFVGNFQQKTTNAPTRAAQSVAAATSKAAAPTSGNKAAEGAGAKSSSPVSAKNPADSTGIKAASTAAQKK